MYSGPPIFIMGPTGSGKSALAMQLAEALPVEIISVDSAQVYRGLDIGTAKPSPADRNRVPHHLVDICGPEQRYSAAQFRLDALSLIDAIAARGRVPLLVGGTGLYFRTLEQGLAVLPPADSAIRSALQEELAKHGAKALHERLRAVDPLAADRIHPNDPQRLVRALEVERVTGRALSALWRETTLAPLAVEPLKFALLPGSRDELHRRLAQRFAAMLARGLVNEVAALRRRPGLSLDCPALRTVGYRAVWGYLSGEFAYEEMVERGVIATRQLAKRQLTWLRRETGCETFDMADPALCSHVLRRLPGGGNFQTRAN